jgi:acetyl esterase
MRDRHGLMPFRAANLVAGCYDLALTPSAAGFNERLILTTRDIRNFVRGFVPAGVDLSNPDISPLKADLRGMPACFLSVGTRDALVDDTLFMASRLTAAGVSTEMKLWPGGCHVFQSFDFPMGRAAEAASAAFIAKHL